jgi:hypothetical protein
VYLSVVEKSSLPFLLMVNENDVTLLCAAINRSFNPSPLGVNTSGTARIAESTEVTDGVLSQHLLTLVFVQDRVDKSTANRYIFNGFIYYKLFGSKKDCGHFLRVKAKKILISKRCRI